jgi:hypothetical protein
MSEMRQTKGHYDFIREVIDSEDPEYTNGPGTARRADMIQIRGLGRANAAETSENTAVDHLIVTRLIREKGTEGSRL